MLDTADSLSLLTLLEIIGPIILAAALVYGVYHSRRRRQVAPPARKGTIYTQDRT